MPRSTCCLARSLGFRFIRGETVLVRLVCGRRPAHRPAPRTAGRCCGRQASAALAARHRQPSMRPSHCLACHDLSCHLGHLTSPHRPQISARGPFICPPRCTHWPMRALHVTLLPTSLCSWESAASAARAQCHESELQCSKVNIIILIFTGCTLFTGEVPHPVPIFGRRHLHKVLAATRKDLRCFVLARLQKRPKTSSSWRPVEQHKK